jgi:hypothetical protein
LVPRSSRSLTAINPRFSKNGHLMKSFQIEAAQSSKPQITRCDLDFRDNGCQRRWFRRRL